MNDKLSLTIIIVNYNSSEYTMKCLDSIEDSVQNRCFVKNIVVVDNNSNKEDIKDLSNRKDIQFILNHENVGFAKACNQGARLAKGDYLLFLNPDTILQTDTIEKSIISYKEMEQEGIGALGVQIRDIENNIMRTCSRFPSNFYFLMKCLGINRLILKWNQFMVEWDHMNSQNVDEVMGAYFLVSTKIFNELNGFDERFFVYYDEVDFCYRLVEQGYHSYFCSDTYITHDAGGTSRKVKAKRLFYEWRSRILFMQKHHGNRKAKYSIAIVRLEVISRRIYHTFKPVLFDFSELIEAYDKFNTWVKHYKEQYKKRGEVKL
mgnify:CR=1 FL=1